MVFNVGAEVFDHLVGMEYVVADLLAPGGFDDVATDVGDRLSSLFLRNHQKPGFEEGHGFFFVLELRSLLSTPHRNPRRQVRHPNSRLYLVHVLSTRPARARRFYF